MQFSLDPTAAETVLSVAELGRLLKHTVEEITAAVWVQGEVCQLKQAPSGHLYFALKDEGEDALIDCVIYRFQAPRARRHLSDGARIAMLGKATFWSPRGRLQFVGESVRPAGRGTLLEELEQLKTRLQAEGLFNPERKRALPVEPRIVGVVTSAVGAAFHDIRTVAFRRGGVRLVLSPALVQGEGAADSIVAAIDRIERYPGLDVLIVGRGGGSAEDLMAFNDERVVRRVALARVPVVSAVGHEVDTSLTDLAADVRAATPSQAAELVVPDAGQRRAVLARSERALLRAVRSELARATLRLTRARGHLTDPRFLIAERQQELDDLNFRTRRALTAVLHGRRGQLARVNQRLHSLHPRVVLAEARGRVEPLRLRLGAALAAELQEARSLLATRAARLHALSPLAVLGRGYAIALHADGRALRDAADTHPGEPIELRLARGQVRALVTACIPASVPPPDPQGEEVAPREHRP